MFQIGLRKMAELIFLTFGSICCFHNCLSVPMADHRTLKNKGLKLDSTEKPRFFFIILCSWKTTFFLCDNSNMKFPFQQSIKRFTQSNINQLLIVKKSDKNRNLTDNIKSIYPPHKFLKSHYYHFFAKLLTISLWSLLLNT